MTTEIIVPTVGESITEATVLKWLKAVGDTVNQDEPLVELETDKVTVEVNAPATGVLDSILAAEEADVEIGAVLGTIAEGAVAQETAAAPVAEPESEPETEAAQESPEQTMSPAVRRLVEENDVDASSIEATGKDGRLTKGDILANIQSNKEQMKARKKDAPVESAPEPQAAPDVIEKPAPAVQTAPAEAGPREEWVRMSRLRQRVAERLKSAQNTAAMLTTFNEVDMTATMEMRANYNDVFEKKHGVKIGYMSIFAKACVVALQEYPAINAEISGDEIIYKNYYDIGIAVGTEQGLVVPVVRDVGNQSFAQVEKQIRDYAQRAREGKLTLDELQGGTFTITNGGIYGSMMSTPILNVPQSGILGMHNIVQRAMVMPDGNIKARPMMYLALTYDHRIVDGREAVGFLVLVKECIEDPQRIMLDA